MPAQEADSRPSTPESPLASSLYHATTTIDDLTHALANFSRIPSPGGEHSISDGDNLDCCCGRFDCEHAAAWRESRRGLEGRLVLSAEVGQALLQKHEAYVRRHEGRHARRRTLTSPPPPELEEQAESVTELLKDRVVLENRLNKALINNEATEQSKHRILAELEEAKNTVSRLTAHHARSVGWDTRLAAALQQRDDMRQERDSEAQRARIAENRIAAFKERTAKLQTEVRRLQDDLELRQIHRLASTESILQEARARLEILHRAPTSPSTLEEHPEVTKVLESLVSDNEVLKQDNEQLHALLADSREELNAAREELEEQKAAPPPSTGGFHTGSVPSPGFKAPPMFKRTASVETPRQHVEPLTPETSWRPLSPTDSFSFSHQNYPPDDEEDLTSPEKPKNHKPLFLLARSRGVQTDQSSSSYPYSNSLASPLPSHVSSNHARSDSSSFSDIQSSSTSTNTHIAQLVERVALLLNRMTQADALTLTNRLKRQHLRGADVAHLSRSTVNNILAESNALRTHFRAVLEDDHAAIGCTRKDLRGLLKVFRELFAETGQIRIMLNDVVLDPASALRLSDMVLDPAKAEAERLARQEKVENINNPSSASWMAPISKLFGNQADSSTSSTARQQQATRGVNASLGPRRIVPKLGPALAASATTVNVEFTGSGVGRSTSSSVLTAVPPVAVHSPTPQRASSAQVMGIFAGAPRANTPDKEPWVVVGPKHTGGPRRMQSSLLRPDKTSGGFRGGNPNRLSRNVDAIIDSETRAPRPTEADGTGEEPDYLGPLLQRTLRRRGLSDSSIHSTFMSQTEDSAPAIVPSTTTQETPIPDRDTVLQAFSKRMQSFRASASPSIPTSSVDATSSSLQAALPPRSQMTDPQPSFASMLPNLSTWTAGATGTEAEPFFPGSIPRDEAFLNQHYRTREPFNSTKRDYY